MTKPTGQQQEALDYFRTHAAAWRASAEEAGGSRVNVIRQRNDYVLQIANEQAVLRSFLDVGCGTGELVCDVARRGVDAIGVDFAEEMIDLAARKARDEALEKARFVCCSIFDFELPRAEHDLISANGFIEYISQQELDMLFDSVAKALAPGGSFVVGSRNRLFNLASMNEFTLQEAMTGSLELLIEEAVGWNRARDLTDLSPGDAAPLQAPAIEHVKTGVNVSTRYQYTPLQLMGLLESRGLRAVEVYPVHIHGVSASFKNRDGETHAAIANLLQMSARHSLDLIPQASSFMLHARTTTRAR